MILNVQIQNFKSLRNVSIDLERFTVFVGANGSGKSSVLGAIHNAVRAATGNPQKVFAHERHGDWIYTRGGQGELSISCRTDKGEFSVRAIPPEGYPPAPEFLQKGLWDYHLSPPGQAMSVALEPARKLVFLHMNAATMALPSYVEEDPPRMEYTGEGLASVLAFMALNDPTAFAELVRIARTLIPRLQRIRFRKATVYKTKSELVKFGNDTVERRNRQPYQGELILLDFDHAENVSARTASEGTMLLLGLLTVLLGPTRPRILLLDDIEHGLHPLAQKQLVEVIGRIMQKFPDLQILATAHSPYLLNYLEPDQVRIMAVGSDGHSRCGRLSDHPKFKQWTEEMHPGELWSLFGENWLVQTGDAP